MTKVIQLSNLMNNRIKLHRISTSNREHTILQHNNKNKAMPHTSTFISTRKHLGEYVVLVAVSTRKHFSKYAYLIFSLRLLG